MEDTLITYETAILAKEKGFQELCFYYYDKNEKLNQPYLENGSSSDTEFKVELEDLLDIHNFINASTVSAPTQSLFQKWLREVHFLHIIIIPIIGYMTYKIVDIQLNPEKPIERPPYNNVCEIDYRTYEEALEAALLEALKLIK